MVLSCDAKFEENLTLWFQNWHDEWDELSLFKNLKICTLWALFVQSVMFQLENFRGIMCHDTER